jgi:periplasmic protein TonB
MHPALDFPFVAVRRFPAWALSLSLVVHLALLAGPRWPRRVAESARLPLSVSFRLPAALSRAALDSALPPARAVARTATERPPAVLHKPVRLAVAGPARSASAISSPPAPSLELAPSAERSTAAVLAHPVETDAVADTADTAAMARYSRLLGNLLAGQQRYPRVAEMRGWQGEVRLRVQMARKGTIVAVRVVQSSGFAVLDQNAVQLVQGTPLPPPPAIHSANDGPDLMIDIPIHFTLKGRA